MVSNLHVLVIGLDPYRVPGPWNPKPVADAIGIGMTALADRGFHAEACLVDLDGSDVVEARVTAALQARSWDCVVVGGGDPGARGTTGTFRIHHQPDLPTRSPGGDRL
jgi:hypothetical protein